MYANGTDRERAYNQAAAAGRVYAEDEAALLVGAASSEAQLETMVSRRVDGEPREVVVGWAEFARLHIAVDPGVFVPRRRTELVVLRAMRLAAPGSIVLDLCCGSSALDEVMLAGVPGVELYAADLDPVAVRNARRTLEPLGGVVLEGDLSEPLPDTLRERIDVVMCNTPYVPSGEIEWLPAEARLYEARMALDGGSDGLDIQRRVVEQAPRWLAPGGSLLVEATQRQAPTTAQLFASSGLASHIVHSKKRGATIVIGTRPLD